MTPIHRIEALRYGVYCLLAGYKAPDFEDDEEEEE